jgi:hypothetical protein
MKKIIRRYANFVSHHPFTVLIIFVIFSIIMFLGIQNMGTQTMDYNDMLPENYRVIQAFNLIEDEFGSSNSGTIVVQIENSYANSNEAKSVLDPEIVRYLLILENYLSYVDDVNSVSGFGQLVQNEYGNIPNNINEIRKSYKRYGQNYISSDESMGLIKLNLERDVDTEIFTKEIRELIQGIDKPSGVKVDLARGVFEEVVVKEQIGPEMSKTSMIAMIAIVVILLLLFRSLKGIIFPLSTILFGIFWTMGFLGLIGSGLSSMTSGAISMIMGIGVDFGIQVMSRYEQELKNNKKKKAMSNTLNGILVPILTTTLACLIGFRAMGLGELSMMAEMGNIMGYGVAFSMLAAVTIVPSLLVIFTKEKKKE